MGNLEAVNFNDDEEEEEGVRLPTGTGEQESTLFLDRESCENCYQVLGIKENGISESGRRSPFRESSNGCVRSERGEAGRHLLFGYTATGAQTSNK